MISDSLNATVIVIVRELTISANCVLEEFDELEELELPRLPAVVLEFELEEELADELVLELLEELNPAVTESPGWRVVSDAILPLIGAYSLVFARVSSAVSRFA